MDMLDSPCVHHSCTAVVPRILADSPLDCYDAVCLYQLLPMSHDCASGFRARCSLKYFALKVRLH